MKKNNWVLLVLALSLNVSLKAQDIIITKFGDEIKVKISEIDIEVVKYRKASNINGPIYNIPKNEISVILYENGTRDIFKSNKKSSTVSKPLKYQRESIYNKLDFVNQRTKKGIQFKPNIEKLINAKEIVWYGWDFKPLVINDPRQADDVKEIIGFNIPQIITILEKQFSDKWIAKRFKDYEKFSSNSNEVTKRFEELDPEILVQKEETILTMEGLTSVLSSYSLSKTSGVGFVMIMENINKPHRYVSGYPTFFDIETREILYTTRMKGLPGSKWGYSYYWFEGASETIDYFFKYVYLK